MFPYTAVEDAYTNLLHPLDANLWNIFEGKKTFAAIIPKDPSSVSLLAAWCMHASTSRFEAASQPINEHPGANPASFSFPVIQT